MHKVIFVIRNKGFAFPADVLTPILEKYNRYVGFAFADGNGVKVVRMASSAKWQPTLESIQGGDVRFKDKKVIYCFGATDAENINNADIQPFSILTDAKNETLLVAFADGDFSGFNSDGQTRPGASIAIEKEITPRISKAFKATGFDLVKLVEEELTDPIMAKDLAHTMIGEQGAILFLAADDTDLLYRATGENSSKDYDWGWVSNTSFIDKPEEVVDPFQAALVGASKSPTPAAALAAPAKTVEHASGPRRPGAKPAHVVSAEPAPSDSKPASVPHVAAATSDKVKEEGKQFVEVIVPKAIVANAKSKSNFLRKRIPGGILPDDWLNSCNSFIIPFDVATEATLKDIKEGLPTARVFTKNVAKSFQEMGAALKAGTTEKPADNKPADDKAPPATAGHTAQGLRRPGAKVHGEYPAKADNVKPAVAATAKPVVKDTMVHHIGEKDKQSKGVIEGVYLIPPVQRAEMITYMSSDQYKEALGQHAERMSNPDKFREIEAPTFVKQMNHPQIKRITDCLNWGPEIELAMIKNEPDVALAYMRDWKKLAVWQGHKINELEAKLTTKEPVVEEEVIPDNSPVKPATPAAPAGVTVSKGLRRPGRAA